MENTTRLATAAPQTIEAHAATKEHHFNLGQWVGLALLGLAAYQQQDNSPKGAAIFTDPAVTAEYLKGVLSLFPQKP